MDNLNIFFPYLIATNGIYTEAFFTSIPKSRFLSNNTSAFRMFWLYRFLTCRSIVEQYSNWPHRFSPVLVLMQKEVLKAAKTLNRSRSVELSAADLVSISTRHVLWVLLESSILAKQHLLVVNTKNKQLINKNRYYCVLP